MLRMEIEFYSEKILRENLVQERELFNRINEEVEGLNLQKVKDGVYVDTGEQGDLTKFMTVISWLQQAQWFQHYVKRWDWYNDHSGAETDVLPESLLEGI